MRLPAKVLLVVAVSFALIAFCGIAAVLLINNVLKQGKLSVGEAREFDEFPLYWLGESYRGLALTEINKFGFPSETLPSKPTVRFTYGDETCVKSSCSAPIWIWIDPYCESTPEQELAWMQHLASLPEYHDHSISDVKVRGVKGYLFGTRIHLCVPCQESETVSGVKRFELVGQSKSRQAESGVRKAIASCGRTSL